MGDVMKTTLRSLLVTAMLIVVGSPAGSQAPAPAAGDSPFEVVQLWACEMNEGVTEVQVEAIAQDWLKAIRQLPGGAAVKMRVFFPVVNSRGGKVDFYFVMNTPTFTDWGKIWDAYSDDTAAAKSEDMNQGKVVCPDSVLWEAHEVVVK
jgi:hypothetical protein